MQSYRADLDGLRALAILSVILFHFEVPTVGAGFSGVDIFFVISGFLICGTSLRRVDSMTNIGDFFRRRIARLLPMVTVTAVVVLILAATLSTALDAHETFRTARHVASFFSNNYLWSKADYFNSSGNINPFLHTWSLGIEEQFYLLI
ncbi:MAG: acyltransferase, partial [Bdellovibrionota bacterium]